MQVRAGAWAGGWTGRLPLLVVPQDGTMADRAGDTANYQSALPAGQRHPLWSKTGRILYLTDP
jgi:hypothetical protein